MRTMAAVRRVSVAELIRQSIECFVRQEAGTNRATILARAKSAVGRFASSTSEGSIDHDRHLADAFSAR
ncbi:MAG: CopG family transcriptional regulator [Acidobacteria bacterium]|nr:CopG family transcriptional regulator [Acidobacteriota bacterium]